MTLNTGVKEVRCGNVPVRFKEQQGAPVSAAWGAEWGRVELACRLSDELVPGWPIQELLLFL